MKIISRFPYLWPQLNFGLAVGENAIEESDIPLAAHGKLEHLSKPGAPVPVRNEDGKLEMVPTPAPISGYEPSQAFLAAAEKHNPKKAAARLPKVATLKTMSQGTAAATSADKAVVDKANADANRLVEGDHNKRRDQR